VYIYGKEGAIHIKFVSQSAPEEALPFHNAERELMDQ
jgi:hypothetical protein